MRKLLLVLLVVLFATMMFSATIKVWARMMRIPNHGIL